MVNIAGWFYTKLSKNVAKKENIALLLREY